MSGLGETACVGQPKSVAQRACLQVKVASFYRASSYPYYEQTRALRSLTISACNESGNSPPRMSFSKTRGDSAEKRAGPGVKPFLPAPESGEKLGP